MGRDAACFGGMVQTNVANTPLSSDIYRKKDSEFLRDVCTNRAHYTTSITEDNINKNRLNNIKLLVYMH
jgi:hypothetical protein